MGSIAFARGESSLRAPSATAIASSIAAAVWWRADRVTSETVDVRVAIVSDIHGNRQAFEAVLDAIEASECEELWCLGDLVGYGADPDACVTLDFMLHRFSALIENLRVYPENMAKNLALLGGVVNSQRLLLELARKGVDRQAAYVIVQRNAMKFFEQGVDFKDLNTSQSSLEDIFVSLISGGEQK